MSDGVAFCSHCGTVLEDVQAELDELREAVTALGLEVTKKAATIKRLRAQQVEAHPPEYDDAMQVLEHWKRVCHPGARELNGRRMQAVVTRLRGSYSVQDLKRACDGYALKPYIVRGQRTHEGPKDAWQADAELIFRDARHVDTGLQIASRAEDLRRVMTLEPATRALEPSSELGNAALRLARYGFAVFPCRAHGKEPATAHGVLDASSNEESIGRYWASHPDHNVAVATGSGSGIVVLDVDGEEGTQSLRRLEAHYGALPTTASVVTPGGGQHFYFQHPGVEIRNTVDYPMASLDVRGDGGYVLVPPSANGNGRRYEPDEQAPIAPMPDWLRRALVDYQRKVGSLSNATDWVKFVSEGVTQGARNDRMTSYVGHLIGKGFDAREAYATALVINNQLRPPLAERELQTIVRSIAKRHERGMDA